MSTKRRCDHCLQVFIPGDPVAVDFNWTLDIMEPLDFHLECFKEREISVQAAIAALPDVSAVNAPLGYWLFAEDGEMFPCGLSAPEKVNAWYAGCPKNYELYN